MSADDYLLMLLFNSAAAFAFGDFCRWHYRRNGVRASFWHAAPVVLMFTLGVYLLEKFSGVF